MLSKKYLVESGSTRPATRLMAISTNPPSSSQRRGRTSFQTSGMTRLKSVFFLVGVPPAAALAVFVPGERSARIDIEDGRMSRL